MSTQVKPTNCQTCDASLDQGYSFRYKDDVIVSALCFGCSDDRDLKEYQETKILRTSFLTNNSLELYDTPLKEFLFEKGHSTAKFETAKLAYASDPAMVARIEAWISYKKIFEKIKLFENEVWFKGLQDLVLPARDRGFAAQDGKFVVMTYSMAGRCMITIEDEEASVTMLCDESSKNSTMGDRGICATEAQAITLIERAVKGYQDGMLKFAVDKKISMGF